MRALSLIPLLCLAFGTPTAAQDIVVNTFAPETCTAETATPVSFDQAATTPMDCVSVEGLRTWNTLFDGVEGYYRATTPDSEAARRKGLDQIGIYGFNGDADLRDAPRPARLTGRAGNCEDLHEPDVIMVLGYCHYGGGPYVAVSQTVLLGDPPERLTGEATRTRLGLLIDPPADWPLRAHIEAKARRWLSLVVGDDPQAYAQAVEVFDEDADLDDPESPLHAVFREPDSVFGRLRAQQEPVMRVWTLPPPPPEPEIRARAADDVEALVCFRLGNWRDDRWPVAPADADNDPSRPFACVRIVKSTWGNRVYEYFEVPGGIHGLREPTTFRP